MQVEVLKPFKSLFIRTLSICIRTLVVVIQGNTFKICQGMKLPIKGIVGFGIPLTAAREKYDDFREVPQDFQNHALRRNDKAFANFRRRCKNGDAKKGYPRHKKRVRSLTWSLRKV